MTPPARTRAPLLDASLVSRHQAAALVATACDLLAMSALVELAGRSPPAATVSSALLGGAVNFVLSRAWAYRDRHEGAVASQAWRYALVAVGGAALNAALLAFLLSRVGGPYLLARVAVSAGVSLLYTYPLHARFVFRVRT